MNYVAYEVRTRSSNPNFKRTNERTTQACQFAWRRWFYSYKPFPSEIEIYASLIVLFLLARRRAPPLTPSTQVFAYVMLCEYFLLVFARSTATIRFLPKILAAQFVLLHFYLFSVDYGFVPCVDRCAQRD